MHMPDALSSRNLRPRYTSHWYGLAALTVAVGSCTVVPLAVAALRRPPSTPSVRRLSEASLRRSLLVAARLKVTQLRKTLTGRVAVEKNNGLYVRAPECIVKEIASTKIVRYDRSITGVVRVACEWLSPKAHAFRSRKEAEEAAMTESAAGKLRLTFVYRAGTWTYQQMNKD